jgi:hypothetical protein
MNLIRSIRNWNQQRRTRRAEALPDGYIDIVHLHRKGLVTAKGTGQSITEITAEIVSRVNIPLKVSVAQGTYFVSRGNHQNMVTRRECRVDLAALGRKTIFVPPTCINATLPIPGQSDRFSGVARVPEKVQRFLEAAQGEDAMVIQAGVWALTDGFTRSRIQSALRTRRVSTRHGVPVDGGYDSGAAISDFQIDKAKKILDDLHIRTNL